MLMVNSSLTSSLLNMYYLGQIIFWSFSALPQIWSFKLPGFISKVEWMIRNSPLLHDFLLPRVIPSVIGSLPQFSIWCFSSPVLYQRICILSQDTAGNYWLDQDLWNPINLLNLLPHHVVMATNINGFKRIG